MLVTITNQDNVPHFKIFGIDFDKRLISENWNHMLVCQSVRNNIVIGQRDCDLLRDIIRIFFTLHLFCVIVLVRDLLTADLPCLWIKNQDFVTQLNV